MRLYHDIFFKLAGLSVFYSGSNESSLAPQFKLLDNTFKLDLNAKKKFKIHSNVEELEAYRTLEDRCSGSVLICLSPGTPQNILDPDPCHVKKVFL